MNVKRMTSMIDLILLLLIPPPNHGATHGLRWRRFEVPSMYMGLCVFLKVNHPYALLENNVDDVIAKPRLWNSDNINES
ncbi:hypothetical protein TSUD_82440 [Trifolium subterraneum]|uniref:Secreted protein n=1 Tax=Trifolium subterraneum TaxID=3900 RepID=A0A2Z6PIS1_TRISU|nr:hypothetical protein TSUD_82440 [Trifolium subterraneum]